MLNGWTHVQYVPSSSRQDKTPPVDQQTRNRQAQSGRAAATRHLEAHDERLSLDVGEGHVEIPRVAVLSVRRTVQLNALQDGTPSSCN
jgi:hypothetical protein